MVPYIAYFASFLLHDHESVHTKDVFCGINIANHRFLAKNIFAILEKDDQQKGTNLRKKRKTCSHLTTMSLGSTPRDGRLYKCISKGASQQVRKDSFS